VTVPSLMQRLCRKMAKKLDIRMMKRSRKRNLAPAATYSFRSEGEIRDNFRRFSNRLESTHIRGVIATRRGCNYYCFERYSPALRVTHGSI